MGAFFFPIQQVRLYCNKIKRALFILIKIKEQCNKHKLEKKLVKLLKIVVIKVYFLCTLYLFSTCLFLLK